MKHDIIKFYEEDWGPTLENMIDLHIESLRVHYNPEEFEGLFDRKIRKKKIELLIKIQDIVDKWEFF